MEGRRPGRDSRDARETMGPPPPATPDPKGAADGGGTAAGPPDDRLLSATTARCASLRAAGLLPPPAAADERKFCEAAAADDDRDAFRNGSALRTHSRMRSATSSIASLAVRDGVHSRERCSGAPSVTSEPGGRSEAPDTRERAGGKRGYEGRGWTRAETSTFTMRHFVTRGYTLKVRTQVEVSILWSTLSSEM